MGIQFSFYSGDSAKGFPTVGTPGTYDIWVDDVQFTTDDSGLQTRTGFPLTTGVGVGSCISPKGPSANAKFLVPAYNMWKKTFASGGKVIRPENGNDTVSEGIAYGMLIAVNFNDQALFDSLYTYWKAHATAGSLMTWCIPAGAVSCSASGGSATDADEDAAYALLMADKAGWGGTYKADGLKMVNDVWTSDIDGGGTKLPKGGSKLVDLTLDQPIQSAGAVQWDGKYVAIGDQSNNTIYQFSFNGTQGTKMGSTTLGGATEVFQFWIDGKKVVGPDTYGSYVGVWHYPGGGSPVKKIGGLYVPLGTVVSRAK